MIRIIGTDFIPIFITACFVLAALVVVFVRMATALSNWATAMKNSARMKKQTALAKKDRILSLSKKLCETEKALKAKSATCAAHEQKLEHMRHEYDLLNKQILRVAGELKNAKKLEIELLPLKAQNDSLIKQLKQAQERYEESLTTAETEETRKKFESLKEEAHIKVQEITGAKADLEKELKEVKDELASLKARSVSIPFSKIPKKFEEQESEERHSPLEAWLRRFTVARVGERIWITRAEFDELEEEMNRKDALIEKYSIV